jgi:hypothetical protein
MTHTHVLTVIVTMSSPVDAERVRALAADAIGHGLVDRALADEAGTKVESYVTAVDVQPIGRDAGANDGTFQLKRFEHARGTRSCSLLPSADGPLVKYDDVAAFVNLLREVLADARSPTRDTIGPVAALEQIHGYIREVIDGED